MQQEKKIYHDLVTTDAGSGEIYILKRFFTHDFKVISYEIFDVYKKLGYQIGVRMTTDESEIVNYIKELRSEKKN